MRPPYPVELPYWYTRDKHSRGDIIGFLDKSHITRGFEYALAIIEDLQGIQDDGGVIEVEFGDFKREFYVDGGFSDEDINGMALGIYLVFELGFEGRQSNQFLGISSFSPEDLPSDHIGFWGAINGYSNEELILLLDKIDDSMVSKKFSIVFNNTPFSGKILQKNYSLNPIVPGFLGIWTTGKWPSQLQMTPTFDGWLPYNNGVPGSTPYH